MKTHLVVWTLAGVAGLGCVSGSNQNSGSGGQGSLSAAFVMVIIVDGSRQYVRPKP